jgi:hypothetical protein
MKYNYDDGNCRVLKKGIHNIIRKLERSKPNGGHKYRWEDNINMHLQVAAMWTGLKWLRIGPDAGSC